MATTWTKTGSVSARAVQGTTETVPTDNTVGLPLVGIDAVQPTIAAPIGQTFTGTGRLLGYMYGPQGWAPATHLDYDMSPHSGLAVSTLPARAITCKAGYLILLPSGVGLSGGTQITTDYVASVGGGLPGL